MPIAFLKPTSQTDTGANIATGVLTDVDEGVSGADGNVEVSVDKQWVTPFFVEWALENLPGDADSINSVILRIRGRIVGTWVDDSVQYGWTIVGTNLAHPTLEWDFQADGGAALANRQQTVTDSPTVANVNAALIRVTQAYAGSMAKESITHDLDCFELEVDYEVSSGITLAVQEALHAVAVDNIALTQANVLAVDDADHLHDADNIVLALPGITEIANSPAVDTVVSDTSITVTHGMSFSDKDVIVVTFHSNNAAVDLTAPVGKGFTRDFIEDGSSTNRYAIFSKVSNGTEDASWTFDSDGAATSMSIIVRAFKGVDASIWDIAPAVGTRTKSSVDGLTATAPSMTTLTDNALGIVFVSTDTTTMSYSAPTNGYGDEAEETVNRPQVSYHRIFETAGVTGSVDVTLSATQDWTAHQFALKPDGVGVTLVMQECLHAVATDSPTLTQANVLSMQECLHAVATDSPTLTQANVLAMQEALHSVAADNVVLDISTSLVMQEALHSVAVDNIDLTQANVLAMQECLHAVATDSPTLTQANVLAMQEALHSVLADSPTLTQANVLAMQEALHSATADNVVLSVGLNLIMQEALHSVAADSPTLTQANVLAMQEALHSVAADNVVLDISTNLAMQEALHSVAADNIELTQANVLAMQEALHSVAADSPELTQANVLAVAETLHVVNVDNIALTQANVLAVQEALHAVLSDTPTLTQANVLAVAETLHAVAAANVPLSLSITMIVDDALHATFADNIKLPGLGDDNAVVFVLQATNRTFIITPRNRIFVANPGDKSIN